MHWRRLLLLSGLLAFLASRVEAHVGDHPSVHDTVAGILDRLGRKFGTNQLLRLRLPEVLTELRSGEREVLASEHVLFQLDGPALVTVWKDRRNTNDPFWLVERGFQWRTNELRQGNLRFEAWQKEFPAGPVGLGVNSLGGGGEHYLVVAQPLSPGQTVGLSPVYPALLRTGWFTNGVAPYADSEATLTNVPPEFAGAALLRTLRDRREDGRLLGVFRWTRHPSLRRPDHVVLTWSGDPQTTQAIQWRTGPGVRTGYVQYAPAVDLNSPRERRPIRVRAQTEEVRDDRLLNDPVVRRHTVELTGLEPGTRYRYSVGDGSRDGWEEYQEFTTAPAAAAPFSFIYMGDAQNGLDRWGSLVHSAFRDRPDAAFYLMAGDLVNRGAERDDWDSFVVIALDIFDRRPVVPVLGNHEYQGGEPLLYLKHFALPGNGPKGLPAERAYSFRYGDAQFVVLDSNLDPAKQTNWLAHELATTTATWKFVTYHHPAYASAVGRQNEPVRQHWVPLFDQYHVDLVLQGHDHAYLRTFPLNAGRPVESPAKGTVYVVAVSGTKFYPQGKHDYTQVGMTNVATYQVLDIQISGHRLNYRAFDLDGVLRDQFVIEK
jgi:hypothetical protein